uniref:Endoribonuclease L-PSP n=1 Tax=Anisakis simplex TaxID=6269 RepID=A0A0M3JN25_ANISI
LPYVGDARQKCLCVKGVPSDWDEVSVEILLLSVPNAPADFK